MAELGSTAFESLLLRIAADYPYIQLIESSKFSWHSRKNSVTYKKSIEDTGEDVLALLHEVGHALLYHKAYTYDFELLQLEIAAWEKARELANHYGNETALNEDYVQDCLDTYRDWLHLRATCPICFARSLQNSSSHYQCFNCRTEWRVSRSRLCRPYRLQT